MGTGLSPTIGLAEGPGQEGGGPGRGTSQAVQSACAGESRPFQAPSSPLLPHFPPPPPSPPKNRECFISGCEFETQPLHVSAPPPPPRKPGNQSCPSGLDGAQKAREGPPPAGDETSLMVHSEMEPAGGPVMPYWRRKASGPPFSVQSGPFVPRCALWTPESSRSQRGSREDVAVPRCESPELYSCLPSLRGPNNFRKRNSL